MTSPAHPETYPRRILLAIGGMTPQVVTETLYYLCVKREPAYVPTDVYLITTQVGHDEAMDHLLDEGGEFHEFVKDYGLEGQIHFTVEKFLPLLDADGRHLPDVRSAEDNMIAADVITEKVRELTLDNQSSLHISISGGRNTLGLYLGYALSMFGRAQDRLSHVLVPWQFEGNDDFFYPPPQPELITLRNRKTISTQHAHITLAEIPFISLRHGLPQTLLEGKASYSQTVAAIQRSLGPPHIKIKLSERKLWLGGVLIEMPPQLFSFYVWLCRRRKNYAVNAGHVSLRDAGVLAEFLNEYKNVVGSIAHDYEKTAESLKDGIFNEFFSEKKARVNGWLIEELGKVPAARYTIQSSGNRPKTRYGLTVDPQAIEII
jgi:CRISPR-associated protein (TIGR02584 family)